MIINSFQINAALQLVPVDAEEIAEMSQSADARVWLDIEAVETDEYEPWLDKLGVSGLSRRICFEGRDRPGFYPLKKEILMVIPIMAVADMPAEADHMLFLCRENLMFTLHRKSVMNMGRVNVLKESENWLPERSISGLVSAVMISMSLQCLQHATKLRKSVFKLEEKMDRDPDAVEAEDILDIRSDLLALGGVVSDQLPSLRALSGTDKPFFKLKDAQEYMNCALVNLEATDRALDWLDVRIAALRSGFQMHAQDRTNRKLGTLTVLSAIFMPITLLAGIWGMNFEGMPELKLMIGYPAALGLMALIALGMYLFFRKGGWFD